MRLSSKLSLARSTLDPAPFGPCLPTAKLLSRAGAPHFRTCPSFTRGVGRARPRRTTPPDMPILRAGRRTCPMAAFPASGHAHPSRRRVDIIRICPLGEPEGGHVHRSRVRNSATPCTEPAYPSRNRAAPAEPRPTRARAATDPSPIPSLTRRAAPTRAQGWACPSSPGAETTNPTTKTLNVA